MTTEPIPLIVCDMTSATDTPDERVAEYHELFATSLVGRERTETGIRFRFRDGDGVEEHVRDLAAREQACCAFFDIAVTRHDGEIWWDASVVDDEVARQILDEMYRLPETIDDDAEALFQRFTDRGLDIVIDDGGIRRIATRTDLGFRD
jgi:hypothetical protein